MFLQKRTPGGVELCTDINWGGTCGYAVQPLNTCIILGDDWKNKISSFGPDPCQVCFGKLLYQSTKKTDQRFGFYMQPTTVCTSDGPLSS